MCDDGERCALRARAALAGEAGGKGTGRPRGYEGFGSFHSGDPEALYAAACAEGYVAPPTVAPMADLLPRGGVDGGGAALRLGAPAAGLFLLDLSRWTFVNHGAFGGALRAAAAYADRVRAAAEANPVAFVDRALFAQVVAAAARLARFVGSSPRDLVLVPNATTGINAVVKSVLGAGAASSATGGEGAPARVLCLDVGYASVHKLLREQAARHGLELVVVDTPRPPVLNEDGVAEAVERALASEGPPWALAVVDWVTSNTALKLPIARMAEACRRNGAPLLVDAAHALGPIAMDLGALGADFVVANAHKHLCAPKGAAMLWVAERWQATVRPLCTSHGANAGFCSAFIWDGCRDYAPALAVVAALEVWERVGVGRAREHMRRTLDAAVEALSARWRTGPYAPKGMRSNMALVGLPPNCAPRGGKKATESDAKALQDFLFHAHSVEAPVKSIDGRLYVRISAHWYNSAADYERLGEAVEAYDYDRDCDRYDDADSAA